MTTRPNWRLKAEVMTPPMPWDRPVWRERSGDIIILLHGLWRGKRAMEPLARHLANEGFSTLNLPYPSSRLPVEELKKIIHRQVEAIAGDRPVHFVTHSLGGLMARLLLADPPSWQRGRLLMLAPPSNGSEIVDQLGKGKLFSRFLGPAGRSLGSIGLPISLPALPTDLEAAVIMGSRSSLPMFRKLLEPENDGIVSVSRGRIPGLKHFCVVDADHTFIPLHDEVWRKCSHFMKNGGWED